MVSRELPKATCASPTAGINEDRNFNRNEVPVSGGKCTLSATAVGVQASEDRSAEITLGRS